MTIHSIAKIMRLSIGLIFFWFGMLKFFSGVSPAEALASMTIQSLSFGLLEPPLSVKLLAIWEVGVGLGFLLGIFPRAVIRLFILHMVLTFSPLILFPSLCFGDAPFSLTIVGQYIIKNLLFLASGLFLCSVTRVTNNDTSAQLHLSVQPKETVTTFKEAP